MVRRTRRKARKGGVYPRDAPQRTRSVARQEAIDERLAEAQRIGSKARRSTLESKAAIARKLGFTADAARAERQLAFMDRGPVEAELLELRRGEPRRRTRESALAIARKMGAQTTQAPAEDPRRPGSPTASDPGSYSSSATGRRRATRRRRH